MTLWIVLAVISLVALVAGMIRSKVCNESLNDDNTLSAFLFTLGCTGTLFFVSITLLCI